MERLSTSPERLIHLQAVAEARTMHILDAESNLLDWLRKSCPETNDHLSRVAGMALSVTQHMPAEVQNHAIFMGRLHDLGKYDPLIYDLRHYPGVFSAEQRHLMNQHTLLGAEALHCMATTAMKTERTRVGAHMFMAAYGAAHHHTPDLPPPSAGASEGHVLAWSLCKALMALDHTDARTQPTNDTTRSYLSRREPHLYDSAGRPKWGQIKDDIVNSFGESKHQRLPMLELTQAEIVDLAFDLKVADAQHNY